jgi:hypothetical protein
MMTDGTVTRTLEAYTFESVEARCAWSSTRLPPPTTGRLAPRGPEDRMLVRHVDRPPNTFHTALASEPAGIGAALQAASAESYRQMLF